MCIFCRAPSGEAEAQEAASKQREGQLNALKKARSAEQSIRNRLVVVIKALQYGWEFAAAYEKIQGGATDDPLEAKARKLMEEDKWKKEAKPPSRLGQRFNPYQMGSEVMGAEGTSWEAAPTGQDWSHPPRLGHTHPFFCFQCGAEGHAAKNCPGNYQY